jgi:uroporphyrinogen decarboxylase
MNTTGHKQRLRAALSGQPVDRVPYALWWHDFGREWSAEGLADATIETYRKYDWDLVKLNPRATYYAEAWGSRYEATGSTQPRMISHALQRVEELAELALIDSGGGVFAEQLAALRKVVGEIGAEVDVIQTVFNPLTIASTLLGMTPAAFREAALGSGAPARSTSVPMAGSHEPLGNPAAVHAGLARIAQVIAGYGAACITAGASGLFFATVDWGTRNAADENFYREYGRPYDLQVLAAVRDAPLNVLHVCREHNLLYLLLDYPVRIFNWDEHGAGNASLAEIAARTSAAVMGGIDRGLLKQGTPETVDAEVRHSLARAGAARLVLAGGCSIDPSAPPANLAAAVSVARRAGE